MRLWIVKIRQPLLVSQRVFFVDVSHKETFKLKSIPQLYTVCQLFGFIAQNTFI